MLLTKFTFLILFFPKTTSDGNETWKTIQKRKFEKELCLT
jgi:hypothetical protein